jgi:hypothetical protein
VRYGEDIVEVAGVEEFAFSCRQPSAWADSSP